MTENTELKDNEREELLALYQVTAQDLVEFKNQQWVLANYALIGFASIIGIPRIPGVDVSSCGRLLLCLGGTLVAVVAAWILWRLKTSIEERRARLQRIFPRLSLTFQAARGGKTLVSATEMFFFLCLLLALGLVLVWWLVYVVK